MTSLAGKTALVTGGSRGIGRAVAERLARAGADVAITVHAEPGDATLAAIGKTGVRVVAVTADLAGAAGAERAVADAAAALGRLDVLVNTAGGGAIRPLLEITAEEWDETFALNTRATFLALRAAARVMEAQGRGSIVNVASIAARGPRPMLAAYAAAKAAVITPTQSAAAALGPLGIRVNAVCPGIIETRAWERLRRSADGAGLYERRVAETALGRAGTAEEVAEAVAWLASNHARYVTGQSLNVCGGLAMD